MPGTPNQERNRAIRRCLATHDGQILLAYMRGVSVEVAFGANATDAELRHREGQRQLVRTIEGLAKQGEDKDDE